MGIWLIGGSGVGGKSEGTEKGEENADCLVPLWEDQRGGGLEGFCMYAATLPVPRTT